MTDRESLLAHVRETYGVTPDFPWLRSPRYAVLRHAGNGKWFGLIMDLPRQRLHLPGTGELDVVNLKSASVPDILLSGVPGAFPAYHMNKRHWITLALDGSFPEAELYRLVEESFRLTR